VIHRKTGLNKLLYNDKRFYRIYEVCQEEEKMKRLWIILMAIVMQAGLLSACTLPGGGTAPTATATIALATSTKLAPPPVAPSGPQVITATTAPASPASPTSTLAPTLTATIIPTKTAAPAQISYTPTVASGQMVKIFMIAIGDNGKSGPLIGCGDSAVAVDVSVAPTKGVLKAALTSLLGVGSKDYGESGLYNSLYQSDLSLKSVSITKGVATISLTGKITLGGECDDPRLYAQIEKTALQFSTVKSVVIYLNGKNLKDVLSLKN
jgi:hypothetical protein